MPIRASTTDFNNLRETATRPITLIRWEHSGGLELLSLSGEVEFNGEIYTAGEVNLLQINNNNSATFTMPATATRMTECLGGTWRGGKVCQIYEIAGRTDDEDPIYTSDQGFLKIDGIIDDSRYANGIITVQVLHKYLVAKFTPRYYVNEFTTTIPAPGSFITVGSDKYQLKSRRVSDSIQRRIDNATSKRTSRLSTAQINSFTPPDDFLNTEVTADGAMLPIVYGRQPVPGLICANGTDASSRYVYVVAWCIGPVLEIASIFNNDAALPAGTIVHNYRGLKCQGVDNYAAGITTPAISYADDWLLTTPAGDVGACYSVIILPSGTTTAPRFQAIIKGRTVYDPRWDSTGGNDFFPDPFNEGDLTAVGYNLQFVGTNGTSPTTGIDISTNAYSITYAGGANIQSNKLSLDGNGDYVTLASTANARFGSGKWTLEITCTVDPTAIGEANYIFGIGDSTNDRCIQLLHIGTGLYVNMSSTGTTWNLANATLIYNTAFAAGVTTAIVLEYDEFGYHWYINGSHRYYIASTSDLYASTATIYIGSASIAGATQAFYGTIAGVRFTKAYNRYGGVHTFDSTYNYCDYLSNEAGYVYSDVAAGVFADIVKNPFYGLGSTEDIDGLLNLWKFNEADYGGIDRDTVSLVISEKRPTVEWVDLIAGTYAEAFWFPEGAGITVKPDRLGDERNPSGWEITTNGEFFTDMADWTTAGGWSHLGSVDGVISSATSNPIYQTLGKPTVAGDVYVVTLSLDAYFGGSLRVDLDGITVIEPQTTENIFTYEFTATGSESLISAVPTASTTVIVGEISIKRKYWRDDTLVAGSLAVTPLKNSDSPNRIIASYRGASSTTANWADEAPITISMPGVGIDGTPVIETRIRYDGLKSSIRTTARAKTKLYRLQGKDSVTWITTDAGLLYQRGMIIELYDAEFDLLTYAVLDSIERIEPGRYLCRGDRYSEGHYPVDLTTQTGTIPVGLIAPLIGTTVPSGWQAYTPATSPTRATYYVKCAGESVAVLTVGGATTYAGMSGDTSTDGAHGADGETTFPVKSYTGSSGAGSGAFYDITAEEAGDHDHTYSTGTVTPDLYTRYFQMVKKITSTSTTWPKECMAFGLEGLHYPDMFRYTAYAKRLFAAAATAASSGSLAQLLPITTDSTNDSHDHVHYNSVVNGSPSGTAVTATHYAADSGGGAHTHAVSLDLDRRVAVHKLSLYAFSVDGGLGPGMIAFWDGTLASLHQDWTLCDGRLGTPFIEGRYLEIAANGEEDVREGNNTLHITGTTAYSAKHEHQGTADTADTYAVKELSHAEQIRHRHTIQDPATNAAAALHHDWEPRYVTLYPVMYNPNPVPTQRDIQLLVEGDMPAASTTVVDASPNAYTATVAGGGSIAYSSTQTLFGLTTLYSTGGRRFYYSSFTWGKKWTIQGFFRNNGTGFTYLFSNNNDSYASRSFSVAKNASGHIELYLGTTLRATVSIGVSSAEWYYVELSYDYATFRLYAGKVSTGTASMDDYASAAFDTYPQFTVCDLGQGSGLVGILPFAGYVGQIRVTNGAARNTGSVIAIPTAAFDNEFESRHLSGAYNWWNECGRYNGYYTNLAPDQEQAVLPWNPGGRASLYREVGQANYTVSVVWPGDHSAGQCGPMVYVDPAETEFALGFNYESALGLWVLWELGRQPSDISAIATSSYAHTDGDSVTLSIVVSGSTITCKVDGVTVITNSGSPTGFTVPAGLVGSTRAGIFVDVNLVTGRPANIAGLVAPFTVTK